MKRRGLSLFYAVAVLLAITPSEGLRAQDQPRNVQAILETMVAAYGEVRSYSDHDVAIYRNADGSERLQVDFRIWFLRPPNFRIDAESKSPNGGLPRREVMWTDGATVRSWVAGKAVVTRAKVQLAGSGMFGTYAYHVPTLLEPGYGMQRRLHELTSVKLGDDENFEGVDCYRIRGVWLGDDYELWVAKTDHFIRKIHATYPDHQLEEIHREIAVDLPIAPMVFRFAPEKDAAKPQP